MAEGSTGTRPVIQRILVLSVTLRQMMRPRDVILGVAWILRGVRVNFCILEACVDTEDEDFLCEDLRFCFEDFFFFLDSERRRRRSISSVRSSESASKH